jgi:hypothetical protein
MLYWELCQERKDPVRTTLHENLQDAGSLWHRGPVKEFDVYINFQ